MTSLCTACFFFSVIKYSLSVASCTYRNIMSCSFVEWSKISYIGNVFIVFVALAKERFSFDIEYVELLFIGVLPGNTTNFSMLDD